MSIFRKSKSTSSKLQAALDQHLARQADLTAKLDRATAALEASQAERRALLLGDTVGDEAAASGRLSAVMDQVLGLQDALRELALRIIVAEAALAAALDAEERERVAAEREASADEIEAAVVELDQAIDAIVPAYRRLAAAIPGRVIGAQRFDGMFDPEPATAAELARCIVAAGLYRAEPGMFERIEHQFHNAFGARLPLRAHRPGAIDDFVKKDDELAAASGTAAALVVGPLRDLAARLRNGSESLITEAA